MSKGGNFFILCIATSPPLCTVSDSRLSYLNMGISGRHQKPQEEATHYYILFVVPLPPHPHSPCSNKQIKWGKLIPLEPLWALHVTHCRAPQLPTWVCVSGSIYGIARSDVCLHSGPWAGEVCEEEERKYTDRSNDEDKERRNMGC